LIRRAAPVEQADDEPSETLLGRAAYISREIHHRFGGLDRNESGAYVAKNKGG
jgi:hypothetical protein